MSKQIFTLIGITLIAFIAFLEYTVVTTALPSIQQVFHVSILNLQWVLNIYSIVTAVFLIVCGRLGDLFGRRLIFYIGAITLLVGSLGAGSAWSFAWLIFFRAVQSIGVAATVTLAPSLIHHTFQDKAHHPMSFYATLTGIALTIGPTVGGFIVMHIGWRWIFYINIPLLLLALACCLPFLNESKADEKLPIDLTGSFFLILTLVSLTYGLIYGEQHGWGHFTTIILLILFICSLIILFKFENKQLFPIMNFHFFKKPVFILAVIACSTGGIIVTSALFFSPLLLQRFMGYTPKESGLILLAIPIAIIFVGPFIGKLTHKLTAKWILSFVPIIGLLASILLLIFSIKYSIIIALISFLLIGMAWTIVTTSTAIGVANLVEKSQTSVAIGTVYSMWNITAAIIVALTSVIFHATLSSRFVVKIHNSFILGFRAVFIFVIAIMVAYSIIMLFSLRNILKKG